MNRIVVILRHATAVPCIVLALALTFVSGSVAQAEARPAPEPRVLSLQDAEGNARALALQADGDHVVLRLEDARRVLPMASENILGFGVLSAEADAILRRNPGAALELSGEHRPPVFHPDTLVALDGAGEPAPAVEPADLRFRPLLPLLKASRYGEEPRSRFELLSSRRLHLVCEPGQRAAGVLLESTLPGLPEAVGSDLRMQVRGQGQIDVAVSDTEGLQAESPRLIGTLHARPGWTAAQLPLPPLDWPAGRWQAVSFACQQEAADLELEALQVGLSDAEPSPQLRAFWVWDPKEWRQASATLLARLVHASAREVFISVPLQDERCIDPDCAVADPEQLARFLEEAHRSGIGVWVVTGDPMAVLPEERAAWLGRARAYADFNRTRPATARLSGVQYDIEPYLLTGFGQAPARWLERYDELLAALHGAAPDLAVDVVVPWWFGRPGTPTAGMLDRLAAYAGRLTVMDYRTDPELVMRAALPFLSWARGHGRDVRIALEAGPLPDQESHHYVPAAEGPLWLLRLGDQTVYVLCDGARTPLPGVQAYADRGGHLVSATQTTFHARLDDLWRAVSRLENELASTRAFAGAAIHGLEPAWY